MLSLLTALLYLYAAETISIYAHEVGHWLAARALGLRVGSPTVEFCWGFPVGGKVSFDEEGDFRAQVSTLLLVYLAGPAMNLVLFVAALAWYSECPDLALAFLLVNGALLLSAILSTREGSDGAMVRALTSGWVTVRR